jgi:hypothetical protein
MAKAHRKTAVAVRQVEVGNAIPQDVQFSLICLALMMGRLHKTRMAVKRYRDQIEAKMPGGSRLVRKPELVAALFDKHNERCAKLAGKAVRA